MGRRFGIVTVATAKFRRSSASAEEAPGRKGDKRRGFSLEEVGDKITESSLVAKNGTSPERQSRRQLLANAAITTSRVAS